jgi:putative transposase
VIYDPAIHHRRSTRWRGFDYSSAGIYFITVCTRYRACLFGEIVDGEMRLNPMGAIVADAWRGIEGRYPFVRLDEWCVMPNHFHGLLILTHYFDEVKQAEGLLGAAREPPLRPSLRPPPWRPQTNL